MTAAHTEIEICLAGPFLLKTLQASPWLQGLPFRRKTLRAIYFDSQDAQIAKARAGLRIRRESGRWVQTLKLESGPGQRAEFNHVLAGRLADPPPALDASGLPDARALKTVGLKKSQRAVFTEITHLKAQFEVQVRRVIWTLPMGSSAIELALDQGSIQSPAQRQSINELELELVSGSPADLWQLAHDLLQWLGPFYQLEPRSKALRGYGQIWPEFSNPPKAQTCNATGFAPVLTHHFTQGIEALAHRLLQIQNSTDPEGVHMARVALRQVRTLLKLLIQAGQPEPALSLLPRCAALANQLGPLRDLDVAEIETLVPLQKKLPEDASLQVLARAVHAEQNALRHAIRESLQTPEVPQLLCALGQLSCQLPQAPVAHSASAFAEHQANLLRKKISQREKRLKIAQTAEAQHRLRLAHKALRYAAPVLKDLGAPQDLGRWAKDSARAQNHLGKAHDKAVALQTLTRALSHQAAAQSISAADRDRALTLVEGFLLH